MKRVMQRAALAAMVVLAAPIGAWCQVETSWPEVKRETKAGSRWWWMGSAVDSDNLRWSMEQYAHAGIGTLEITPIYGVSGNSANNIPFLSNKWLEMLQLTQQLGEQYGIDIDMTTGTGWPSGGPMVKAEESASKLMTETLDVDGQTTCTMDIKASNGTLQKVMALPQGDTSGSATDLTSLVSNGKVSWTAPEGKWQVIAIYNQPRVMQVKRPSPGSEGYVVDYFDSTAVANYLSWFDARFEAGGSPWPHSFFNDSYEINQADWTPCLLQVFEKRRGYKLEEHIDKLLKRDAQTYADYRQTLSELLLDNFTRQWTAWAHRHGATTRNQAHGSPGNLIDLYAAADIPEAENFYQSDFGIRGLRRDPGFSMAALSTRTTLKYASSAAHITGKKLTSSESMTWLTEHFRTSLSQIKPELDLLFTSGINHVLFHGTAYSPREAAWPGWKFYASIDMSPTNSIWRDAPEMMKYIERVQSFLQMGSPDNEVLVLAPFTHAMHKTTGSFQNRLLLFDINTMGTKMPEMAQCVAALEAIGHDCDYTSDRELMLTTYSNGRFVTSGGATYTSLVIPEKEHLPDSVLAHLDQMAAEGADIIYGRDAEALAGLKARPEALRLMGLSVIRRSNATGHHYFIANLTGNDIEGYASLPIDFSSALLFDPMTGDISDALLDDSHRVWISLHSGESVILRTYDTPVSTGKSHPQTKPSGRIYINGEWTLHFTDDSHPATTETYLLQGPKPWESLSDITARLMGTGVYETTFHITPLQKQTATEGFLLDLGDVRESARVWLNDEYVGCAWAVPFTLDLGDKVREGANTLRIEVTNLPANRISQMDRDGVTWRIFEDINFSNISTASYAEWALVPSGLNSKVALIPLTDANRSITATLTGMVEKEDGNFYTEFTLEAAGQQPIGSITLTDQQGTAFEGYEAEKTDDGGCRIIVKGASPDDVVVCATDGNGNKRHTYLPAFGPYQRTIAIDFTSDEAPGGGWMVLPSVSEIKGFSQSGKQQWCRATANGKIVDELYEGLTFLCDKATYYFYFPGYGMNCTNDFTISVDSVCRGTMCQLAYLVGDGTTAYNAADSITLFKWSDGSSAALTLDMPSSARYHIYRSLCVYQPDTDLTAITVPTAHSAEAVDGAWYNLQGMRVTTPRKGVYLRNKRKVVVR